MKKLENTLYALTLVTLFFTILIKSFGWPWIGSLLIIAYSTMAFIFMLLSWLIYTTRNEQNKRVYFLYGTILFGHAISSLLITAIAKLQHWNWYEVAAKMTLLEFILVALIFVVAYVLAKNNIKKNYLKQLIIKTLVFIAAAILFIYIDFDEVINRMSSKEVIEQKKMWERERQRVDSIYQNSQNR